MTIYILDTDQSKTAEYLDDLSLDQMIRDIAHVLHYFTETKELINTSTDVGIFLWQTWCKESDINYQYLLDLGMLLCKENKFRFPDAPLYAAINKYQKVIMTSPSKKDIEHNLITLPLIMPERFKLVPAYVYIIDAYRRYYQSRLIRMIEGRKFIGRNGHAYYRKNTAKRLQWTKRQKPFFIEI